MKLYTEKGPKNIKTWLAKAHARARELGYSSGTYIVQLFVTGAVETNVEKTVQEWPANSMVFTETGLDKLFRPFGDGLITAIVESLKR